MTSPPRNHRPPLYQTTVPVRAEPLGLSVVELADALALGFVPRVNSNKLHRARQVLADRLARLRVVTKERTELDRLGGKDGVQWLEDCAAVARIKKWKKAV